MSWLAGVLVPLQSNRSGLGGILSLLVWLAIVVAVVAGIRKAFEKAGEPGWAAIVPIYNVYVQDRRERVVVAAPPVRPGHQLPPDTRDQHRRREGVRSGTRVRGLGLLSVVFWPLLGFGDYEYRGVPGEGAAAST